MAEIDVFIAGRTYQVACRDGEEDSLRKAAALVDAKSREALAGPRHAVRSAPAAVRFAAARRPDGRRRPGTPAPPPADPALSPNAPNGSPTGSNRSPIALEDEAADA